MSAIRAGCFVGFVIVYLSIGNGLAMVVNAHSLNKGCDGLDGSKYTALVLAWPIAVGAALVATMFDVEPHRKC